MPMTSEDIDEMIALIAVARKRPLNFGLCMGKKPDSTVFFLHRMKAGEVLARQAKKEGDTAKIAAGTVEARGKVLTLTCTDDIPPGIAKSLKRFLSSIDMPMKVIAIDAMGNVAEAEGEETEEEDQVPQKSAEASLDAQPVPETDRLAATWEKVAPSISAMVQTAVNVGADKATQLAAAWEMAQKAAGQGKFNDALAVAAKIRPLLQGMEATPVPASAAPGAESSEAKSWGSLEPTLAQLFETAMRLNPENRAKLTAAWSMASEKAEAGDFTAALQIAARLKPALDLVIQGGSIGTAREIPKDVVPFQKSRVIWSTTRSVMMKEMAKLESAILSACAGDAELAPIATEVTSLRARLDVFDTRLEDVLDEITNTPEGAARSALKVQARGALDDYVKALESDFFLDVDDENGFVQVAVAASARKALGAIAKVLS